MALVRFSAQRNQFKPGARDFDRLVDEGASEADAVAIMVTCAPDCYQSEVESGSFMMVG